MPVLAFERETLNTKPLAGMKVAGCLHVTKKLLFSSRQSLLREPKSRGRDAIRYQLRTMLLRG